MRFRRIALAGISAVLAVLISCGGVRDAATTVQAFQQVQREVGKAVGQKNVGLVLTNGKFLTVRLVNSPLNDLSAAEKTVKAFGIAQLAYGAYPSRASLQTVTVVFVTQRSYLGIFTYGAQSGAFRFNAAQLADGAVAMDNPH